jgi:hypothetical protein
MSFDHAEMIEGRLIVQSISYDYGALCFRATSRKKVIEIQKELISPFPDTFDDSEIGDFESDSFSEAFDYCDFEKSVVIEPVTTPNDLREYAKDLLELAEMLEKDNDLILSTG